MTTGKSDYKKYHLKFSIRHIRLSNNTSCKCNKIARNKLKEELRKEIK